MFYCLFSVSTCALASVSAVDAGSRADFASPQVRNDRTNCTREIFVHFERFLIRNFIQGVEEASMFTLFPEGVPFVQEGVVNNSLGR